jgi:hypothetical protein
MSYKGKYTIKYPDKYIGDPKSIVYRSLWERQCFKWCESNPRVRGWNSEEIVIPYMSDVDGRLHRYYVDLLIVMENDEVFLVEIKPKKQTQPPKKPKRKTKKYAQEVATYITNTNKWGAAQKFAEQKEWKFQIWTEETLKNLGIKLLKG